MNIFCIMGYTASGKDTVVKEISDNYNVRKIVPITTRPMREGERNGIDYFFYDEDYFIGELKNLIAVRKFKVWNNEIWTYAFDKRAFKGNDNVIMSTDLTGFRELKYNFPKDNVIGIFLDVPVSILVKRLEERKTPEEEIIRRLEDDLKKYKKCTDENIFIVRNINLKITIEKILKIIENEDKRNMVKYFDRNKLYLFDIEKYRKDVKKRIKKSKTDEEKYKYKESLREGENGFAKELMERKYTFSILNNNIGIYTYKNNNYVIYPQWCKEVTLEEYREELDSVKRGEL